MWELVYKESWGPKNRCFWTVMLEKTLEIPLDCKEIQPVQLKGNQSWIFIGRTDVEAETPILLPPDAKNWLIWKDPDAGRDWGQEEKGMTEDAMAGWHHQLDGHEWVNSGSRWWTGRSGMLQSMGSQRVGHDWATELNWTDASITFFSPEKPRWSLCSQCLFSLIFYYLNSRNRLLVFIIMWNQCVLFSTWKLVNYSSRKN